MLLFPYCVYLKGEAEKQVKLTIRVPPVTPKDAKIIPFSGDGKALQEAFGKLKAGDVLELTAGKYELPSERQGNGFFHDGVGVQLAHRLFPLFVLNTPSYPLRILYFRSKYNAAALPLKN